MISEKYILLTQIAASFFMGLDYFFTEKQRNKLNVFLLSHLQPLLNSEKAYLTAKLELAKKQWINISLALILFTSSLLSIRYVLPTLESRVNLWVLLTSIAFVFLTLLANSIKIFDVTFKDGVPVVFSVLKSLTARFLINCPKGTGFGVGFLLLAISFGFRGANISW